MATSDGGASWTRQYAGQADLNQVDFVDGDHGWAAGGGTLLRTANGGATWTPLAEPCQGELSSVHFVSPAVGYAVAAAPAGRQPVARRPVHDGHRRHAGAHRRRRRDLVGGDQRARQPAERVLRQRRRRLPRHPRPHLAHHRRRRALDARADRARRVGQPDDAGRHPGDPVRGRDRPVGALPRPGRRDGPRPVPRLRQPGRPPVARRARGAVHRDRAAAWRQAAGRPRLLPRPGQRDQRRARPSSSATPRRSATAWRRSCWRRTTAAP